MDIKDSYLHGTIGVVKSISVNEDKLTYTLADINQTTTTVTLPTATQTANGLLSSTDKIKLDTSTGINQSIPYIVGPTTDTTPGTWTGTYVGITDYTEGLTIIYVPNVAGASTTTLNINGIGSKVCYYTGSSKVTTHYPAGTPILFTYSGGYWKRADYAPYQLRVYRQTTGYDADYPILVSRTLASSIGTSGSNSSYSHVYSLISDDSTKTPTINPLTGEIKAPKFTGTFNGTASSVTNSLIFKINSGSTEGTSLYTYNGAANKTLDIKQGNNVTLTATEGTLTIAASDSKVTQSDYTGTGYLRILLSSNASDNTNTGSVYKSNKLTFKPSDGLLTTSKFKGDWTYTSNSRSVATIPSDYKAVFKFVGIKDPSAIGLTKDIAGTYVSLFGWKGWSDNSGPDSWELASGNKQRIYVRSGVGIQSNGTGSEDWNEWHKLAYTSDIPTKVSDLTNDSGYITGGPYLPLNGGIMTNGALIKWNESATSYDWESDPGNGFKILHYNSTKFYGTGIHIGDSFYRMQLAYQASDNNFKVRASSASTTSFNKEWRILLDTGNYNSYSPKLDGTGATGNWEINITGSAAKLTTPRTIWGQSFDGSTNVSGNMIGVGNINYNFRIKGDKDNNATLNVEATHVTGGINYSHLYVTSTTGNNNTRPLVLQNGYGNVGIGVIAPVEKLEVNGNIKATTFKGNLDWSYIQNKPTGLPANGGNADTVDNYHAINFLPAYGYNYANGYLVKTDIPAESNSMITFKIEGNGHYQLINIFTQGCFYNYNVSDSIINCAGTNYGLNLEKINVFNYDNVVCLWFEQTCPYQSFLITVTVSNSNINTSNRVVSVSNSTMPSEGVTRLQTITPNIGLRSDNYTNYINTINFPGLDKTGTVTSVGLSVPTGFSVSSSPITTSGTLGITFASGYSLPTTAKQNNWDTVYNWYTGITATDTDALVNKWGEIVDFLDSVAEGTDITDEFVTRKTNQEITGIKTFTQKINVSETKGSWISGMTQASLMINSYTAMNNSNYYSFLGVKTNNENIVNFGGYINNVGFYGYKKDRTENDKDWYFQFDSTTGNISHSGTISSNKFITRNGTSAQFVKGNGSLDSTTYATSKSLENYLPLSGGTLTGWLKFNNEQGIIQTNPRYNENGGGWSNNSILSLGPNKELIYNLGCYGWNTDNKYVYLGHFEYHSTNNLRIYSNKIVAPKFVTNNGSATEFVKGDGSLDSTTYATSESLGNYLPLTGGTLTGNLTISGNMSKIILNVKFNTSSGWTRDMYVLRVDGVRKFAIGGYGSYTTGATDNDILYVYLGCNSWNGLNLRISPNELKWGDNPVLHSDNYTSYTPILNSSSEHATNTSVIYAPTTAGTSGQYLMSTGSGAPVWTSLPSLASPYAIKFKNSAGTVVSYNGSQAVDLSGGVYNSTLTKYIQRTKTSDGTNVSEAKANLLEASKALGQHGGILTAHAQSVQNWNTDDFVWTTGGIGSFFKIGGGYDNSSYSTWLASSITPFERIGVVRQCNSEWRTMKYLAWVDDIPPTLKNPYSIKFINTTGTAITYDGSVSVDLSSGINYATKSSIANNGIFYIEGTGTTAGTWLGEHDEIKELYKGLTIAYKIPVAGASPTTLKINNLQAVTCMYNQNRYLTTHYPVGAVIVLVYDGTYFKISYYDIAYQADCYNITPSSTSAKTASASYYKLRTGNLFICTVYYDNTAAAALTLNVNNTGAKPIWINGTASSATNYTLPAGRYLVYYDGTNYYFYTNGGVKIPQVYGNASSASVLQTARTIWGQSFDGSGNIEGDLTIIAGEADKSIQFLSGSRSGSTHNWRIAYIGTGMGDTNYLSFESSKSTTSTWEPALQLACLTLNATFAGTVTAPNFVQNSNGTSDFTKGVIQIKALNALTNATATEYGKGTAGQILRSNGSNVYWSDLSKLTSTAIKTNKSYPLKNSSWTDTGYSISGLETGSYMIQVTSTNMVASGIFSVQKSLTDTMGDEIPLHVYGSAGWRPYLRTNGTKLEISANNASEVSRTVTIKIVQII